jgi:hypothetical protein
MNKNKKGYIGAIGDDLPSLIPIFVGLTIFFAVFLNTYNVYRNNTDLYSLRNDAINISGIIKENPLISDQNQFIKSCNRVKTKYNWNAFVTPLDLNSQNYKGLTINDLNDENIMKHWAETANSPRKLICNKEGLDELKTALQTKDVTVYKYPITVQQQFYVEPAWLYVVVWK